MSDPLMPGGTSGDPTVSQQIGASAVATSVDVPVVTIDEDIAAAGLPAPHLVKIDIEGMELPALRGMTQTLTRHHPEIYLEVHGATVEHKERNVREIVRFLNEHGYHDLRHIETGTAISSANATVAREDHLYCRAA